MHGDAAVITLTGVTRTFVMGEVRVPVLRGVDLEIPAGRLTVLLGPSGSGKTTLLNLLGGIDRATTGTVMTGGQDLTTLSDKQLERYRRRSVGFVFQFYNLVPTLTALENVMVGTEISEDPMDPLRAIEMVGLTDRMNHFPAQLSGGEQQRVAVARALAKNPALLLCDEPTGALDLETGRHVLELLRTLTGELGKAIVIVTHNSAIAALADRVVRIGSGVIESVRDNPSPAPVGEVRW